VSGGTNSFILSYRSEEITLTYVGSTESYTLQSSRLERQVWKAVSITLDAVGIAMTANGTTRNQGISPKDAISRITEVQIGQNFNGFLQDIIVYSTPLQGFSLPTIFTYLPQCYCEGGVSPNGDCDDAGKESPR